MRKRWTPLGVIAGLSLIGLWLLSSCATTRGDGASGETCRLNFDCSEGLSCVATRGERKCIAVAPIADQTCGNDEECEDGKTCKAGRCGAPPRSVFDLLEERCEDDNDCPDGKTCDATARRCRTPVSDANTCASSWDCTANETCAFGRCERQAPFTGCRNDFECGGFQRCVVGRCQ